MKEIIFIAGIAWSIGLLTGNTLAEIKHKIPKEKRFKYFI